MRILLVDDEECVTEALDRLLCQIGDPSWDIVTASSGAEAIQRMEEGPFSILVADLRMPKMTGDELLATAARRWPETVRVVLSGQASEATAVRAAMYAHQFLAKPCTHAALVEVLARSERFGEVIRDPTLRSALAGTITLPPSPATYAKLTALLSKPEASVADVADVIKADPALSAKVLQLVNSAFFAAATRITDVNRAATRLGVRTIQTVVLSAELHRMMASRGAALAEPWADGERAAAEVFEVGKGKPCLADVWTAALLSPVGLLALSEARPEAVRSLHEARARGVPTDEADRATIGTSRYLVSAALLSVWGLPDSVVEPLRVADSPMDAPEPHRMSASVLNVALARAQGRPPNARALALVA